MGKKKKVAVARGQIDSSIYEVRGERVILDADLAGLYGVTTKRLKRTSEAKYWAISGRFYVSFVNTGG